MSNLFSSGGAGNVGGGDFSVGQSLKFNDDESQYLSWTPASAGNRKTWTWSGWVKRGGAFTLNQSLFSSATNYDDFRFDSNANLSFVGGTSGCTVVTTQVFRDPSAWMHVTLAFDSTQATASDRIKIYVNGEQVTAFASATYPALNRELDFNNTVAHAIGRRESTDNLYADFYLADVYFIDGQALDPTSFGETVDGYWKPKEATGLTYGDNGFHLTFQDDIVSEGFNAVTYRGTGATQSVSGLGFSPDFVWAKSRVNSGSDHYLYDSVRGINNVIRTNSTGAEFTYSGVSSFDGDGFTLGSAGGLNASGESNVAWCWDAGTGSPASNTQGSITSTVKANPSYGFSITSYTGNGTAGATIGHGLSSAPQFLAIRSRDTAQSWLTYDATNGGTKYMALQSTQASSANSDRFNNTDPTSSVITLGTHVACNTNAERYICYAWHSVAGYSKISSYTGNGTTSNSITGLGFKPAFLMIKNASASSAWYIFDNTRDADDVADKYLRPNLPNAEGTLEFCEFTADGFDITSSAAEWNGSGNTIIYMAFADTREYAFWKDVSGNGNNWTPNNLDYRDSLPDVPTNSFAVFNALAGGTRTLSEGNLKQYLTATSRGGPATFTVPQSGKWYWETMANDSNGNLGIGVSRDSQTFWTSFNASLNASYYANGEYKIESGTQTSGFSAFGNGDILSVAVDADVSPPKIYFGYNGTWQNSADPAAGTGGFSLTSGETYLPMMAHASSSSSSTATMNFGQDSTFAGTEPMGSYTDDSGYGVFQHQPPAGFKSLCSANLPTPTIIDGSQHFNTVLYTGTGATQSITGVGFGSAPDFVWIKDRTTAYDHHLFDVVRGGGNSLYSNDSVAENTYPTDITFASDGFSIADGSAYPQIYLNKSSDAFVSWNWKAGGTAVSNTDGSITSQVSANVDAGFSILSWTTQSGAFTTGHGLSQAPEMFIEKNRTSANNWTIYHKGVASDAETDYLLFTTAAAADDDRPWNDTAPTSTVIHHGNGWHSASQDMIGYAFHSVEGFSKVGSFTGNGSNQFVYTGFRPAFLLVKRSSNASGWYVFDSERGPYNPNKLNLSPNSSASESTASGGVHFLSNGFEETGFINDSGQTVIYLAIAETPFKYANAR